MLTSTHAPSHPPSLSPSLHRPPPNLSPALTNTNVLLCVCVRALTPVHACAAGNTHDRMLPTWPHQGSTSGQCAHVHSAHTNKHSPLLFLSRITVHPMRTHLNSTLGQSHLACASCSGLASSAMTRVNHFASAPAACMRLWCMKHQIDCCVICCSSTGTDQQHPKPCASGRQDSRVYTQLLPSKPCRQMLQSSSSKGA